MLSIKFETEKYNSSCVNLIPDSKNTLDNLKCISNMTHILNPLLHAQQICEHNEKKPEYTKEQIDTICRNSMYLSPVWNDTNRESLNVFECTAKAIQIYLDLITFIEAYIDADLIELHKNNTTIPFEEIVLNENTDDTDDDADDDADDNFQTDNITDLLNKPTDEKRKEKK